MLVWFRLSSMVWGLPARVYWHIRAGKIPTVRQSRAAPGLSGRPPKPPSLGGPAAMVLGPALPGRCWGGGEPSGGPARGLHDDPDLPDPRAGLLPPGRGQKQTVTDEDPEERTCCKNVSRARNATPDLQMRCQCGQPVTGSSFPVNVGSAPDLEAGSRHAPDWEPGEPN